MKPTAIPQRRGSFIPNLIESITHIANADGTLKAEYSYDAWGRLRNPATHAAYAPGSEPILFLRRGYTGHEHLYWFGLINMNFASKREQSQAPLEFCRA